MVRVAGSAVNQCYRRPTESLGPRRIEDDHAISTVRGKIELGGDPCCSPELGIKTAPGRQMEDGERGRSRVDDTDLSTQDWGPVRWEKRDAGEVSGHFRFGRHVDQAVEGDRSHVLSGSCGDIGVCVGAHVENPDSMTKTDFIGRENHLGASKIRRGVLKEG